MLACARLRSHAELVAIAASVCDQVLAAAHCDEEAPPPPVAPDDDLSCVVCAEPGLPAWSFTALSCGHAFWCVISCLVFGVCCAVVCVSDCCANVSGCMCLCMRHTLLNECGSPRGE